MLCCCFLQTLCVMVIIYSMGCIIQLRPEANICTASNAGFTQWLRKEIKVLSKPKERSEGPRSMRRDNNMYSTLTQTKQYWPKTKQSEWSRSTRAFMLVNLNKYKSPVGCLNACTATDRYVHYILDRMFLSEKTGLQSSSVQYGPR